MLKSFILDSMKFYQWWEEITLSMLNFLWQYFISINFYCAGEFSIYGVLKKERYLFLNVIFQIIYQP